MGVASRTHSFENPGYGLDSIIVLLPCLLLKNDDLDQNLVASSY